MSVLQQLADAEPAEASDILQDIGNATSADDLLHSEDIANLTNILRLSASQGLLNDSTLDEATQQNNRKANENIFKYFSENIDGYISDFFNFLIFYFLFSDGVFPVVDERLTYNRLGKILYKL